MCNVPTCNHRRCFKLKLHQDGVDLGCKHQIQWNDLFTTKEIVGRILDDNLHKINRLVFQNMGVFKTCQLILQKLKDSLSLQHHALFRTQHLLLLCFASFLISCFSLCSTVSLFEHLSFLLVIKRYFDNINSIQEMIILSACKYIYLCI